MSLATAAVLLLVICAVLVFVAVDRTSRATAWRRIAEERRWNTEQLQTTGAAGDPGADRHVEAG
jgi:uncharacterized membrane protein YsdA (DUF1294 family)